MGIGEKKTPKPFVNACDVFVYTENLVDREKKAPKTRSTRKSSRGKNNTKTKATATAKAEIEDEVESDPLPLLEQAFDMAVQEDGWARLDMMGSNLYQLDPGFDPRTYGHKQLSRLVGNLKGSFEMRTQEIDGSMLFYVKMKE
jgi:hypothetical protein